MEKVSCLIFLVALTVFGQALTPSTFFSDTDVSRLRAHFEAAFPFKDLATAHYSTLGLSLLGVPISNSDEACKYAKSNFDANKVESIYYASSISNVLKDCSLPADASKALEAVVSENSSMLELFYAVSSMKNLKKKIDTDKVSKVLLALLKKDDTVPSLGHAFHIAALLGGNVDKFYDRIEDAIVQADEVNGKYLQFEQGAGTTALVIDGIYKLGEVAKKAPTITEDQVTKFANYLVGRKHTSNYRSAYLVLRALKMLTSNKYHVPIAVTLDSTTPVSSQQRFVRIRVSDMLGGSLGGLTVVADKATRREDSAVILSKRPLKPAEGKDKTLYEFDLMDSKPEKGFYEINIMVSPTNKDEKRLVGTADGVVLVKVVTEVTIENIEIALTDRDQSTTPTAIKLQHPQKLKKLLEADFHQKVLMKFSLKDKMTGNAMAVHQAFVRFTNKQTQQEIHFVTEPDSNKVYKFDMDVQTKADLFEGASGDYSLDLIIGDAVITNNFVWSLADMRIEFPEGSEKVKSDESPYAKKPEITHLFREPEKRPPTTVSNAFTVLVLIPFLVLFVLWAKIGLNVSNFPLSLSAIGFHLGLIGVFVLYYFFWLKLNMFDTLKYLAVIGGFTFLCGNRLLGSIAAKR